MGIDIIATLLPALFPAFADGFKMLFGKIFGSVKPTNVDDVIKLANADTQRLQALSKMDEIPEGMATKIWPFIANWRAINRYAAVDIIILSTILITILMWNTFTPQMKGEIIAAMYQLCASSLFYLIGDRVYLNLKGK